MKQFILVVLCTTTFMVSLPAQTEPVFGFENPTSVIENDGTSGYLMHAINVLMDGQPPEDIRYQVNVVGLGLNDKELENQWRKTLVFKQSNKRRNTETVRFRIDKQLLRKSRVRELYLSLSQVPGTNTYDHIQVLNPRHQIFIQNTEPALPVPVNTIRFKSATTEVVDDGGTGQIEHDVIVQCEGTSNGDVYFTVEPVITSTLSMPYTVNSAIQTFNSKDGSLQEKRINVTIEKSRNFDNLQDLLVLEIKPYKYTTRSGARFDRNQRHTIRVNHTYRPDPPKAPQAGVVAFTEPSSLVANNGNGDKVVKNISVRFSGTSYEDIRCAIVINEELSNLASPVDISPATLTFDPRDEGQQILNVRMTLVKDQSSRNPEDQLVLDIVPYGSRPKGIRFDERSRHTMRIRNVYLDEPGPGLTGGPGSGGGESGWMQYIIPLAIIIFGGLLYGYFWLRKSPSKVPQGGDDEPADSDTKASKTHGGGETKETDKYEEVFEEISEEDFEEVSGSGEMKEVTEEEGSEMEEAGDGGDELEEMEGAEEMKESAEAVAATPNYTIVPVFYGTDRAKTDSDKPEKVFGGARGTLVYGMCEVSIPRSHKIGEIESPLFGWKIFEDPDKHIILEKVDILDTPTFMAQFREKLAKDPKKSILIFVHGYNVSFDEAAKRTAQIAYDLKFKGVPAFYSWPSKGKMLRYPADESTIEWSQPYMKTFFEKVLDGTDAENVYVIGHSMGTRALSKVLAEIVSTRSDLREIIKEIILSAPDIDAGVFKRDIAPKIVGTGQRLTLYASSEDLALKASKEVHDEPRAGESGDRLVIVNGMDTIDATGMDTGFLKHSYYGDSRSVIDDIYEMISDGKLPSKRFNLDEVQTPQGSYYKFRL